jgi:hypothetical protein
MTDLADRLREIEQNPAPELWEEIESRAQGQDLGERFDVRHRVIAGLVATIVSLAAFAFLFAAFRPSPNRVPTDVTSEPMRIEVRTRPDGSNLRITARFEGEEIELVGIETPGPDLEYPRSGPVTLPTGTPVVVDAPDGVKVSLFELAPAQGMFVVDRGACLEPGALRALPGPAETAFFIYIEGEGFSAGQAFTAVTTGQTFEHPSAIDPRATTDGDDLGLAACGVPHLLTSASGPSGDQALLRGTIVVESGCLAVSNGPDSNVFVVWPQGYSLDAVDGEVWLVDDAGTAIARIGDEVQMGGGITGLSDAGDDVVGGIPGPCQVGGPDSYWFAGTPELVTSIATSHAADAEPVRIDGVPFPVCRPMSIPGRFAGGSDTAWIFERAVDEDCEGDEGFQYVAIGSSDAATAMSGRVQSGLDSVALWPYAAVDIDRDGFDEIAVGVEGSEADRRATIILFRLRRSSCSASVASPASTALGSGSKK